MRGWRLASGGAFGLGSLEAFGHRGQADDHLSLKLRSEPSTVAATRGTPDHPGRRERGGPDALGLGRDSRGGLVPNPTQALHEVVVVHDGLPGCGVFGHVGRFPAAGWASDQDQLTPPKRSLCAPATGNLGARRRAGTYPPLIRNPDFDFVLIQTFVLD
jgi:hypothetical protein